METDSPPHARKLTKRATLKDKAIAHPAKNSDRHVKPNKLERFKTIMQLIQAHLHGSPRTVNTKHGERTVADAIDGQGNKHTIWRNAGEMKHLTNGSIVSLAIDSKGKVSLVDEPTGRVTRPVLNLAHVAPTEPLKLPFEAETQLKKQMGFTADSQPSRSVEIADYIERLGKLYTHCLTTAVNIPTSIELESTAVKDIATTMFIQTARHFDL
jgi:hypothetical protein